MLLAVDSSSESLKLGLVAENRVLAEYNGPADRSHSEKLLSAVESLLTRAAIQPAEIQTLALVVGPGSFTGLRVGAAAVLGLAQAWGLPIRAAAPHHLHHLWLEPESVKTSVAIHCRADQFFISASAEEIEVKSLTEIIENSRDLTYAGPGAARLRQQAREQGPGHLLQVREPASYGGGELALLFANHPEKVERFDPLNVDLNYLVKSQPERLAEAAAQRITISDMKESDLDEIMAVESSTFTDAWQRETFLSDLQNPRVIALVARRAKNCIGYLDCLADENFGYLANVAIVSSERSQGVGRALLDELCVRLRRRGKFLILLDVRLSNHRAISFYERYGFSKLRQSPDFYTQPVEDSYTMGLEMKV